MWSDEPGFKLKLQRRLKSGRGKVPGRVTAVTRLVMERFAAKKDKWHILDFGAGVKAYQTLILRDAGFRSVRAFDLPANMMQGVHFRDAWTEEWDLVMASNVLNVQPSWAELQHTLKLITAMTGGVFICSYPSSPRFMKDIKPAMVMTLLKRYFLTVERVPPEETPSNAIWICGHPAVNEEPF